MTMSNGSLTVHHAIGCVRKSEVQWLSEQSADSPLLLLVHHFACGHLLRGLAAGTDRHTHRWFRVFNEIPVLGLLAAVVLVVVKPF